jgi:Holliday junction resolvase
VRRAARRDDGEREIIDALRKAGAYVKQVNDEGLADLLVWHGGRTLILEVKDGKKPPSARKLTEAEQKFHNEWPGDNLFIVNSVEDALKVISAVPD